MNRDAEQLAQQAAEIRADCDEIQDDYTKSPEAERRYWALVASLRSGDWLPAAEILTTLVETGRSAGTLILHVFGPSNDLAPGSDCPKCHKPGSVGVSTSRRLPNGLVTRYLRCIECGANLGSQTVLGSAVRRRRKRPSPNKGKRLTTEPDDGEQSTR